MAGGATASRRLALDTLRAVREGELVDRALGGRLERLDGRDRPWTQELVYGTLRLRGRLDHLLDELVHGGLEALEPAVLDVLRLGAYQLLEMGSVPAYAGVSQSVELAKRVAGRGAGGLVNGVLHALRRRGDAVEFPAFEDDPAAHLATWGSHPRWLVDRWIERFGAEGARGLIEANNRRPELYIRPIGLEADAARRRLARTGIGAEPVPFAPDALRIPAPATVADVLDAVPAVVQDPAAGLVVRYAAVREGSRVLDLCAAPGGKALALAESAGRLTAADVSVRRLALLEQNLRRLPVELPVRIVAADARRPPFADEGADAVLVDAPCTGTGTLRRHPDGRWRLGPGDLDALAKLQSRILRAAAGLVSPGGLLVYATCSLEAEENEAQVDAFLADHPEYELAAPDAAVEPALLDARGRLRVLPQRQGVDGAFAARLRRRVES